MVESSKRNLRICKKPFEQGVKTVGNSRTVAQCSEEEVDSLLVACHLLGKVLLYSHLHIKRGAITWRVTYIGKIVTEMNAVCVRKLRL